MTEWSARLMGMSRPSLRSVDPLARPKLTVLQGGMDETDTTDTTPAPTRGEARADVTDGLADLLIEEFGDQVLFLFHRRVPGQSGDLPIVAVTSLGVHLVEPRAYPGKKVRACRDGSAFVIDGMRHSRLAEQMQDHCEALQATVSTGPLSDAPVEASYCFVDGDLPWRPLEIAGFPVLSSRRLVKRLRGRGPLDERQVEALHRDLSLRLERT